MGIVQVAAPGEVDTRPHRPVHDGAVWLYRAEPQRFGVQLPGCFGPGQLRVWSLRRGR